MFLRGLLIQIQVIAGQMGDKAKHDGAPELPNFITLLYEKYGKVAFIKFLHHWENIIFSLLIVLFISLVAYLASRKSTLIPGKLQNFMEMAVEGLDNFICDVLGPKGRKFTPFLGTLFIYILCMNFFGLIPGMKSPSSNLNTTVALAICVFFYVQYTGMKSFGFLLFHSRWHVDHQTVDIFRLKPF